MNKSYFIIGSDGYVSQLVATSGGEVPDGVVGVPANLPVQPSPWHRLHWGTLQWVDQRTLDMAKAAKRAEINAARNAANTSTFTFGGKQIAADGLSQRDIDKVALKVARSGQLPADFPGAWKAVDNTYVPIPDVATWDAFMDAMIAQGTANFTRAQARKAAIESATTVGEVDTVVW